MDENKYKRKIKNYEKEGVIYTPSTQTNSGQKAKQPATVTTRQVKRRKKKSQFGLIMALMIFTGFTLIIISFALVFSSLMDGSDYIQSTATPTTGTTPATGNGPIIQESTRTETVAMIRSKGDRQLELYDLENDRIYNLTVDGGTILRNKYGEALVFAELRVGEIVEISFDNGSDILNSLSNSARAIDLSRTTNVKIDYQNGTITVGNDHYYFTDMISVMYNNQEYELTDIKPIDIVTLKGYKGTIWSVEVIKSHGTLQVLNKDHILNGTLEINTNTYMALSDSEQFDLLEGTHKIIVKGSNITSFTKDITISVGETTVLDLSEVSFTAGNLIINVSEPDAVATINGVERPLGEEFFLNFGEYALKVTKEGFETHEETILFESVIEEINVTLIELPPEVQVKVVSIETDPSGAQCYVDNIYYGDTPVSISLEHGLRTIRLVKEGYLETTIPVYVDENTSVPLILLQTTDLFIPEE